MTEDTAVGISHPAGLGLLEDAASLAVGRHGEGAVFRRVAEFAARCLPAEVAVVLRCDAFGGTCQVLAAHPPSIHRLLAGLALPAGDALREVAAREVSVALNDDLLEAWGGLLRLLADEGMRATAGVRIWSSGDRPVLLWAASARPFSAAQLGELKRVALTIQSVLGRWETLRDAQGSEPGEPEDTPPEDVTAHSREVWDALAALTHLYGSLSHDLNNALAVIIGHCQLLLEELGRDTPAADRDDAAATDWGPQAGRSPQPVGDRRERVREIMERALRLVGTARALQECAAGRPVEPLQTVDLGDVAGEAVSITSCVWGTEARLRGCPISLRCEREGPAPIRGVPAQVKRALVHLIFNAIQAMPPGGGNIRVRVRREGRAAAHQVICEVADDGVGMGPEVVTQARKPFFTTRPGICAGLGLSLAEAIARQHGGSLELSSEEGRGSLITIRLPEAPHAREAPARTRQPKRAESAVAPG